MFELFDLFSEESIVTFLAAMVVLIPVGVFMVVKAAKEAGKEKKAEGDDQS